MSEANEIQKRVPLSVAKANIGLYKSVMTNLYYQDEDGNYVPFADYHTVPRGFAILHADLIQLLGLPPETNFGFQHFRVYFGMESDPTAESKGFKYYMVPMKANIFENGSDDIQKGAVIVNGVTLQDEKYVCDFSLPCPNTCDEASELFHAGDPGE